jgi:hypothetical protein
MYSLLALAVLGAGCTVNSSVTTASEAPNTDAGSTATPAPRTRDAGRSTRIPKPDAPGPGVGPGNLTTNDVSILYPLPPIGTPSAAEPDFIKPGEVGNHGPLLAAESYRATIDRRFPSGLDHASAAHRGSGYDSLALIALRATPCSDYSPQEKCVDQIAAVFQVAEVSPAKETRILDGAIHVIYELPADEMTVFLGELATLVSAQALPGSAILQPHPILAQQGLHGPFARGLRGLVLYHLGDARIARLTVFDHNFDLDQNGWTFAKFARDRTRDPKNLEFALQSIPTTDSASQTIGGSSAQERVLEQSSAFIVGLRPEQDDVTPLVMVNRHSFTDAVLRGAFTSALRLEEPSSFTPNTTSCANCHLAEGAKRIGRDRFGFPDSDLARVVGRVDERTSTSNLHAFGYLGRQVSIMQRTANESARVISGFHVPK